MKYFIILSYFLIYISVLAFPIQAQENIQRGETVELPRDRVINSDYFTAGEKVIISGTINGDAYIAGGNVLIDGEINGDLLVAGGNISIRGSILQDVRAVGGNITISSSIGGNVTVVAGSVNITDSTTIDGSLVGGVGNLEVFGPIGKGVTVGSGNVILGSTIGSSVIAGVGQLNVSSDASISGDLVYWSDKKAAISENASISGTIKQNKPVATPSMEAEKAAKEVKSVFSAGFKIVSFLSALIYGLLFIRFFATFSAKTADIIRIKPLRSFLTGLVLVIGTPILAVIILITIVGIPLSAALFAIFGIYIYISKNFVSYAIGRQIATSAQFKISQGWVYLLGLIVFYLASSIPIAGWIINTIGIFFGVGALFMIKMEYFQMLRGKKLL